MGNMPQWHHAQLCQQHQLKYWAGCALHHILHMQNMRVYQQDIYHQNVFPMMIPLEQLIFMNMKIHSGKNTISCKVNKI